MVYNQDTLGKKLLLNHLKKVKSSFFQQPISTIYFQILRYLCYLYTLRILFHFCCFSLIFSNLISLTLGQDVYNEEMSAQAPQ
jgi:hypothetical protein